jgi:hypothetical protein
VQSYLAVVSRPPVVKIDTVSQSAFCPERDFGYTEMYLTPWLWLWS